MTQANWFQSRDLMAAHGLGLPSEAEWEYACRAGSTTPWFPGDKIGDLQGYANIADGFAQRTMAAWQCNTKIDDGWLTAAPVGSYRANGFGLHDVHGNVWEWCRDDYSHLAGRLPADETAALASRFIRGGSYYTMANNARAALHGASAAAAGSCWIGLRPARDLQ